jgi:hypothetical protein
MRFDWKPESKERYFRKAEAAVKAAGFDDILRVDRDQFPSSKERSRYISNRFQEMEKHADGGRQRERLRICMKYLRQKTSSAGNTRAFSFTPT